MTTLHRRVGATCLFHTSTFSAPTCFLWNNLGFSLLLTDTFAHRSERRAIKSPTFWLTDVLPALPPDLQLQYQCDYFLVFNHLKGRCFSHPFTQMAGPPSARLCWRFFLSTVAKCMLRGTRLIDGFLCVIVGSVSYNTKHWLLLWFDAKSTH